jgi:cell division protein FtsQ
MSIDPRLMERRKVVAEDTAKRSVGRLLRFLALILAAGAVAWLVLSPWLSVSRVTVNGVESSEANSVLVEHEVKAGTPMVLINAGQVETALLEDAWVAEAEIQMGWPDQIVVDVVERVPAAWVLTAGGWARRAIDGVALPSAAEPDDVLARVEMETLAEEDAGSSTDLLGALEFAASLPADLATGAVLTLLEGELWAAMPGYTVRLGRPDEMTAKALSLAALHETGIADGSTVTLIAATNPAVSPP